MSGRRCARAMEVAAHLSADLNSCELHSLFLEAVNDEPPRPRSNSSTSSTVSTSYASTIATMTVDEADDSSSDEGSGDGGGISRPEAATHNGAAFDVCAVLDDATRLMHDMPSLANPGLRWLYVTQQLNSKRLAFVSPEQARALYYACVQAEVQRARVLVTECEESVAEQWASEWASEYEHAP